MKEKINRLILLVCLAFACVIGFAACNLVTAVDFKLQFIVDGEIYATIDTAGEETIRLPNDPEKNGYIFDGWYWDENTWERPFTADSLLNEKLTSDMSVYAKWKDEEAIIREFTVTFNSMGGSSVESKTVKDGDLLTEPAEPKYDGYIFNGWYKDEACTQSWVFESDKVTASITLYAGWVEETATTFTVTYMDGAETLYTKKVVEDGKAENINISKEGYTFKGWLLDGAAFDFATPITENITLTADWEIKTYTVTFIADGEQVKQLEVDYLGSVPEIPEVPSKTGYIGTWNITDFSNITKELTVTAVYAAKTYTAALDYAGANTGNSVQSIMLTYGQPIGFLPTPGKTDCTFSGWFYEGTQITASTIWQNDISTEITFTAKWIMADNGHAIVASDYFTFTDETTLTQDGTLRNAADTYDLRGKFTVSAGASWRAFTSEECVSTSEITTRIASVNPGWNNFYILVENNTTYAQTVYKLRIYRNRILQIPVYYNETVQYATMDFEENITAGETENAVLPAFTVENYSCDGKYYSDVDYTTEWTDDVIVTESAVIYIQAYCHDVIVRENTVIGMKQQPGNVHLVIPEKMNGWSLITIQAEAFLNKTNIVAVTLSDKINSIGTDAFKGTGFFKNTENWEGDILYSGRYLLAVRHSVGGNIEIKEGTVCIAESAFRRYYNLTNISIPDSMTTIGNYAFDGCSGLTSITIPDSVTSIGYRAFYGCSSLTSITLPFVGETGSSIGNTHFGYIFGASSYYDNCDYIPNSLCTVIITGGTSIGFKAFYGCNNLTSITIPFVGANKDGTSDTHFGYIFGAEFSYYNDEYVPTSLHTVIIAGGTSIGNSAFSGCSGLTSITIPGSVTSIGNSAFSGCSGLTSITIPGSVTSIGSSAFFDCSGLTSITVPDSVTSIGKYAFSNTAVYNDTSNWINGVLFIDNHLISTNKTLAGIYAVKYGVVTIADNAFCNCDNLTNITIPDSVTSIGSYAFSGCNGLMSVTFDENSQLTSIGSYSFEDCSSLTSITIPDSVTRIGYRAFYGCSSLESMILPFIGANKDGTSDTHFGYIFGASSYSDNNLSIPASLRTIIITGGTLIGSFAFYGCSSLTSITIPDSVTSIGNYAFDGCSGLTSITIPDSVTSIGSYAFYKCSSLTSIIIPDSVTTIGSSAFSGCSGLTSITIPDSVTTIGEGAFYNCNSLTSITIPDSVTSIGRSAFSGCSGLTSITIPDSVTSIGSSAFSGCSGLTSITIPDSVTSIGSSAFSGCSGLTSITIPDSVTSIGDSAFYNCNSLTSVTIGNGVTSIGRSAFYGCSGLTSITIPNSVTSIGSYAFYGCYLPKTVYINDIAAWCGINFAGDTANPLNYAGNLYLNNELVTELTIPNSVTSIGSFAFYGCRSLKSIIIPDSVTSIGNSAFKSCNSLASITLPFVGASKDGTSGTHFGYIFGASSSSYNDDYVPTSLHEVIITEGTSIESSAFYGCSGLTSITIPDSVTSIGDSSFYNCSSLTSITIPDSVTSIGSYAFAGCYLLKTVYINDIAAWCGIDFAGATANPLNYAGNFYLNNELVTELSIPDSVTSIGSYAFNGCSSLASITIGNSVTSMGEWVFSDCSSLTSVTFDENSQLTSIGSSAFEGCSSLTSIAIPDSVTSIGNSAFEACRSLKSIIIPDSVTSIGNSAFKSCNSLASITLPFVGASKDGTSGTHFGYIFGASSSSYNDNYVPTSLHEVIITEGTSIENLAFKGCRSLTSIMIHDRVTSVGDGAFSGCSSLMSVTFGENSQLTSIGNSAFYNCKGLKNITIPDSVMNIGSSAFEGCSSLTSITIPDSVTSIESSAFEGCSSLTSITIPDSVMSIGSSAFEGCSSLTSITIPDSVTSIGNSAFEACSSLKSIIIPDSVMNIGSSAFEGCSSLTSITIPDSVTSIGSSAFSGCSGLTSITIPDSVTTIGRSAFYGCSGLTSITIPDSVTSIGDSSFYNCSSLTSITIPDSVTSIGSYAFYKCSSLTSIIIPDSVTGIGQYAFSGCSNLIQTENGISYVDKWIIDCEESYSSVILRNNTVGIADYAFYGCSGLTSVTIPNSVTSIGSYAFYKCSSLTSIIIPGSVTSIGDSSFYNCSSLTSITIPDSVTSIGSSAFSGCSGLTSITIPDSVTSIGDSAFYNCNSLTSVTIGNGVTSIGSFAFYGCSSLTSITIPDSVTTIGRSAFYGCSGLTSITIPDSVTSIGNSAFKSCNSLASITLPFVGASKDGTSGTHFGYIFGASSSSYNDDYVPTSLHEVIITEGTSIESSAFEGCSSLTSITIPDSVTSIGRSAFYGCSSLTSITIPDSVTSIGSSAFYGCYLLKTVYINDIVAWCGIDFAGATANPLNYAGNFYLNNELVTELSIPDSVTSIGSYAFYKCSSLTSIIIPDSVTGIGQYAFSGCSNLIQTENGISYVDKWIIDCEESYSSVILRNNTVGIADYAFFCCSGLTSITIPDSVTSIGDSAFYNCNSLTSVTIGNGVTSIGRSAFYGCSSLTSITIPDSVTTIGRSAFYGCSSLTNVTFENASGWWVSTSSSASSGTSISESDLADPSTAATYLTSTYYNYYWKRS